MKLVWVTDLRLNFLESADRKRFYQDVVATGSNAVLVSGDIAETRTVLDCSFRELKIPEIVSFTAAGNAKSIRVMQKIGLQHNDADDFDHPKLGDTSPLKRHVLYRISQEKYMQGSSI